jgi:ribosomal protein L2
MIYRRESPKTPSTRFKSVILNPIGSKIKQKSFYKIKQKNSYTHFGKKVCSRRKKSEFISKFNLWYGTYQNKLCIVSDISLHRRYKTFVGLVTYSNGAITNLPLFSGAYLNQLLKTITYQKTPKLYFFSSFKTGMTVPVAYLQITACFFNIMFEFYKFSWFCRAAGTFCTIIRINIERGRCTVKIPSNKFQIIHETAYVMLGRNSNILPKGIWLGKAGLNMRRGFRPVVRGVAKNPVDHPHGGRTKTNSPERTPWGKVAKFNK